MTHAGAFPDSFQFFLRHGCFHGEPTTVDEIVGSGYLDAGTFQSVLESNRRPQTSNQSVSPPDHQQVKPLILDVL
jgi:hypothetical protein